MICVTQDRALPVSFGYARFHDDECLLAFHADKLCYLAFVDDRVQALEELRLVWHNASSFDAEISWADVFSAPLLLIGTDFRINAWRTLLQVPSGHTVTYSELAELAGKPQAVRAVASAVANNNISIVVPCHRVVSKAGKAHKYRWGSHRKVALLAMEKSQQNEVLIF